MSDCSNSSALAMELMQSCTKPSKYTFICLAYNQTFIHKFVHMSVYNNHWIIKRVQNGKKKSQTRQHFTVRFHSTFNYHQNSNIRCTSVANKIVHHSGVVGASPVDIVPTTSSFSTWHQASIYCTKRTAWQDEENLTLQIWCHLY